MPIRGRGKWSRRLRKHDKPLGTILSGRRRGSPMGGRLLGFETLEERQLLAVQPFPVPLDPMQPLSPLVYRGTVTAAIDSVGETETFTIQLDGPQKLTLLVEPNATLQPSLAVVQPASPPLASAVAAANGERAVLQSVLISTAGTYSIEVTGAGGSVGSFSLQVFLNSALEADRIGGPANISPAAAQHLDGSFLSLVAGTAERGAVIGLGNATGPQFTASQTHTNDVFTGNVLPYNFSSAPAPIGDATLKLTAVADLDASSEFLTVNAEGLFSQTAFVTGGQQQQLVTTTLTIPQSIAQQLAADGTISINVTPSSSVGNLGSNYLTLDLSYPILAGSGELGGWYDFSLADGQSTTISAASSAGASLQLELYGPDGSTLLAAGTSDGVGKLAIDDFKDVTSDSLPGTYYLRVASASEYSLVVTRNATLEAGLNSGLALDVQDITQSGVVLGRIGAGTLIGSNGPVKVGVLNAIDGQVVFQLQAAGMNATSISPEEISAGSLLTQGFDVFVLGRNYSGNSVSQPFVDAVRTFVQMGGGLVTEWDGVAFLFDQYHPTYRFSPTMPQSDLLTGQVGSGEYLNTGTPINKVLDHPIWTGLPDQFSASSGTEFFFTLYGYDPAQIDVIATYPGNGSAQFPNQPFPAVFVSREYNIVGMPFDWQDNASDPFLVTLYTNAVRFADSGGNGADDYSVEAVAGNVLTVQATVPAAGPGEFVNTLDLALELYDPLGNLVASDANGSLVHVANLDGAYTVRVLSESGTRGEYVLHVSGQTGALPAFKVSASSPAAGSTLVTPPGDLFVDLTDSILLTSVNASDLTIDGLPATGVTVVDHDTLKFSLPVLVDGTHTLSIAAGALHDLQGQSLEAFSIQLTIDANGPRVIGTSLLNGQQIEAGPLTYEVTFSEPLNESTLDTSDVQLVGLHSGVHFPIAFDYNPGTSKLVAHYDALPEDDYTLTILSGPGGIQDAGGNFLDGERHPVTTVPSGDGINGGDFALNFIVDTTNGVFPVPLFPAGPLGSLMYSTGVSGRLSPASDLDEYTIALDAGQTLSLVIDPEFQALVTVLGPGGTQLASAMSSTAGDEFVVQTLAVDVAGTYKVRIASVGGAAGNYSIGAIVNALVESESHDGPPNNEPANAEDLESSFIPLGTAGAERGSVIGQGGAGQGPLYFASQTQFNNVYYPNTLNFAFPNLPAALGDATLTVSAIADLDASSEYLTISAEGLFSQNVFVFDGQQQSRVTTQLTIPLSTLAQLAQDGTIQFTVTPSFEMNDLGPNELTLTLEYTIEGGSGDWYRFTLDDGESVSVALASANDADLVELYDASGTTRLATGYRSADESLVIQNYVDRTTNGAADVYYVRAFVVSPDYQLVVTRDADFDAGGNDSFDSAQDLTEINQVLGHVSDNDEDWHQFAAIAGNALSVTTSLPGSGPLEFVNPLSAGLATRPHLELYDPTGALVKFGDGALNHIAQLSGNYRVRVLAPQTSGEYLLSVAGATGANTPPRVVSALPLDGTIGREFPTTYSITFSEALLEGTLTADDLLVNGLPAAASVTQTGRFTFTFDLNPAINVGDGLYTFSLAAGAVQDLQGKQNAPFAATFTYDTTGPRVLNVLFNGAALPPGASLLAGPLTVQVSFNEDLSEEIAAGQLGAEDVVLTNKLTQATIAPTAVSYDPAQNKFTMTFPFIDEALYDLTLLSGDGAFEDRAGNDLDGEPIGPGPIGTPSGNGVVGGNYTVEFAIDAVGARSLAPLERLRPLGSFMAVSENNLGVTSSPGDVDDFQVYFEAGQVLSAVLTPDNPQATMFLSLVGVAGPVFSIMPGKPVTLPAQLISAGGPLTLRVLGDVTTTYKLDVYANAVSELVVGDSANGREVALDGSRLAIGGGRWGAVGEIAGAPSLSTIYLQDFNLGLGDYFFENTNPGTGDGLWHLSTGRQLDGLPNHSPANSIYFGRGEGPMGGGNFNTGTATSGQAISSFISLPVAEVIQLSFNHFLSTDGVQGRDIAEIAVETGAGLFTVASTADGSLAHNTGGSWKPVTIDLSQFAGQFVRLRFRFDSVDAVQNQFEGWYVDDVQFRAATSYLADLDEYTLDLTPHVGRPMDFAVAAQPGGNLTGATIELLGPDGVTVVATASPAPLGTNTQNIDQAILGYVPTLAGRYTLRIISNKPCEYGVVVTAALPIEAEPNDELNGTPRSLNETHSAVGFLGGADQGGSGSSRLFALDASGRQIVEFDPQAGTELNRFNIPGGAAIFGFDGLAFDGHSLFYATAAVFGGGYLYEMDPDTGAIRDVDELASLGASSYLDSMGAVGGLVFTVDVGTRQVFFIDTVADQVVGSWTTSTEVSGGSAGAGTRGSVFISNASFGTIVELDADNGQLLNSFFAPSGNPVTGLAFTNGRLYAGTSTGFIYELDPDSGALLNSHFTGVSLTALGGDDGSGPRPAFGSATGGAGAATVDPAQTFGVAVLGLPGFAKDDPIAAVVGNELAQLAINATSGAASLAAYSAFAGAMDLLQVYNDYVVIDAVASGSTSDLLNDLVALGLQNGSSFGRFVSGWLPIRAITEMASLASLRFAQPAYKPVTSVGNTTSQAVASMHADEARTLFGVDGAGVTVGVLSDSYDRGPGSAALDIRSGDLPGTINPFGHNTPVRVLNDLVSGTDEGRAMMQLIHDVAPGAGLAFHTAVNGQADFASGIIELQAIAGANVIVDDVIYFAEPMFQDGIIAQAIDTVVANGATFFSAAGNDARDSWEGAYRPSGNFLSGRQLHDFDPGPGVDVLQNITVPLGATVRFSFQWDSPFFSVSGGNGSPNDLDFFILDSTGASILAAGTTNNVGGDALEVVTYTNSFGIGNVNLAIGLSSGAAPNLMKWVGFGHPTVNEYATFSATAYGHTNAAGAMAVGAADYRATPVFGTDPAQLESFSSAGGIPILFDSFGSPIFQLRDRPQIVAPDGTNTTFFGASDPEGDGFPNFYGTSAAAPHAAAVAALMRQLAPGATPTEIYNALTSTAIDMDDPATIGFDVGFDSGTGAGLIHAVNALTRVTVDPLLVGPAVTNVTPGPGTTHDLSIKSIALTFSEQLSTASANNAAAYHLIHAGPNGVIDGGGDDVFMALTPLYDGATAVALTIGDGNTPLGSGKYRLIITGDGTLHDLDGNPLNSVTGTGGGSDFAHDFEVVFQVPAGGDFYRLDLDLGQRATIATQTPWHDPLAALVNDLDAQLIVYDSLGTPIAFDSDSADGRNALISFVAAQTGTYYVQAVAEAGSGEYLLDVAVDDVVLLGDYNRDGSVDAADYTVWRNTLGTNSTPYFGADGNGDGAVGTPDYRVWKANFGTTFATARNDQLIVVGAVGGAGAAQVASGSAALEILEVLPASLAAAEAVPAPLVARATSVVEAKEAIFGIVAGEPDFVPDWQFSGRRSAVRSRDIARGAQPTAAADMQDLLAIVLDRDFGTFDAGRPGIRERTAAATCEDATADSLQATDEFFSRLEDGGTFGRRFRSRGAR